MRPRGKVRLGTHWSVPYKPGTDRCVRAAKCALGHIGQSPIMWQTERVRDERVGDPPHITGQWYGYGKGKPSGQSRPALRRGSQRGPGTDRGQGAGTGAFARKEADWRRHPSPSGGSPGFPCASGRCPTIPKGPPHRLSWRSRIRSADCRPRMTLYYLGSTGGASSANWRLREGAVGRNWAKVTPLASGVSSANCRFGEDATNGSVGFLYSWQVGEVTRTGICGKFLQYGNVEYAHMLAVGGCSPNEFCIPSAK
jgi:hypothetical protein